MGKERAVRLAFLVRGAINQQKTTDTAPCWTHTYWFTYIYPRGGATGELRKPPSEGGVLQSVCLGDRQTDIERQTGRQI